jgi:hypothetical protein
MLLIDSSLPPIRFVPWESAYRNSALGIRSARIAAAEEERREYEMQWATPESIKNAASVSIAKNTAGISNMIALLKKSALVSQVPARA